MNITAHCNHCNKIQPMYEKGVNELWIKNKEVNKDYLIWEG